MFVKLDGWDGTVKLRSISVNIILAKMEVSVQITTWATNAFVLRDTVATTVNFSAPVANTTHVYMEARVMK